MAFADLAHVKNWTISKSGDVHGYNTSDTAAQEGVVDGPSEWTATVMCEYTGAGPALTLGVDYSFQFYENGQNVWDGDAIVSGIGCDADIDSGSEIELSYELAGTGALTEPTGSGTSSPFASTSGNVKWEANS